MMQCTGTMWMAMQQSLTTSSAQAQHGGGTRGPDTDTDTRKRMVGHTHNPKTLLYTLGCHHLRHTSQNCLTQTHACQIKVPATYKTLDDITTPHSPFSVMHIAASRVPLPPLQRLLHTQIQGTRLWNGRHNHTCTHLLHSFLQRRTAGTAATCLLPHRTGRFTRPISKAPEPRAAKSTLETSPPPSQSTQQSAHRSTLGTEQLDRNTRRPMPGTHY